MTHDFYVDTFDTIEGKYVLYSSKNPEKKYEVDPLLDCEGNETDDPELAVGGIVKFAEECYSTFMWKDK